MQSEKIKFLIYKGLSIICVITSICLSPFLLLLFTRYQDSLPLQFLTTLNDTRKGMAISFFSEIVILEVLFLLIKVLSKIQNNKKDSYFWILMIFVILVLNTTNNIISKEALLLTSLNGISDYYIDRQLLFDVDICLFRWFILLISITLGILGLWISLLIIITFLLSKHSQSLKSLFSFKMIREDRNEIN